MIHPRAEADQDRVRSLQRAIADAACPHILRQRAGRQHRAPAERGVDTVANSYSGHRRRPRDTHDQHRLSVEDADRAADMPAGEGQRLRAEHDLGRPGQRVAGQDRRADPGAGHGDDRHAVPVDLGGGEVGARPCGDVGVMAQHQASLRQRDVAVTAASEDFPVPGPPVQRGMGDEIAETGSEYQ